MIKFNEHNTPISTIYNDIYYNDDVLAEIDYVFLQGNNLQEKFNNLEANQEFTIIETGFGTGLNFFASWDLFENTKSKGILHFISFEKHPIDKDNLSKIYDNFPQFNNKTTKFLTQYQRFDGCFLHFIFNKVKLTLIFGDANLTIKELRAQADCVFLDAFAPSKNADFWSENIFKYLSLNCKENASLTSFSVAKIVKENLSKFAFQISKRKGFANKREMLIAHKTNNFSQNEWTELNRTTNKYHIHLTKEDFLQPWQSYKISTNNKQVAIIGAGIAGCATAYALSQKGFSVLLIEEQDKIATKGSGNRQGITYLKLPKDFTNISKLLLAGFHFSANLLSKVDKNYYDVCSLLQLLINEEEEHKYQFLSEKFPDLLEILDKEQASIFAGIKLKFKSALFKNAGWLNPPKFCESFLNHPNISLKTNTRVENLIQNNDKSWVLETSQGKILTNIVVLANAQNANKFSQTSYLPIKAIRGQTTTVATNDFSKNLKTVLCSDNYLSPNWNNEQTFGATFDLHSNNEQLDATSQQTNINNLQKFNEELANSFANSPLNGKAGFRATTFDYFPIVGQIFKENEFRNQFADLRKNSLLRFNNEAPFYENLFVNVAHGSRGMITAPICGEILANMICGSSQIISKEVINALNPARFLVKSIASGKAIT